MNLTETERLVRRIESYLKQPDVSLDPDVNKKDIFGLTPLDAVNHIDLNSRDRGELEKKPQEKKSPTSSANTAAKEGDVES